MGGPSGLRGLPRSADFLLPPPPLELVDGDEGLEEEDEGFLEVDGEAAGLETALGVRGESGPGDLALLLDLLGSREVVLRRGRTGEELWP